VLSQRKEIRLIALIIIFVFLFALLTGCFKKGGTQSSSLQIINSEISSIVNSATGDISSIESGIQSSNNNTASFNSKVISSLSPVVANKITINKDLKGDFVLNNINPQSQNIVVDLQKRSGMPLFKKISLFTIGGTPMDKLGRDIKWLDALRAPTMRYPLCIWGSDYFENNVKKWIDTAYDLPGSLFMKAGNTMYWHLGQVEAAYNYQRAGADTANVKFYPPVFGTWDKTWEVAAKYIKEEKIRSYYEVLNECDHNAWYKGTWNEYIDIYNHTANALRKGNPDAEVGGLSSGGISRTLGTAKLNDFLNSVQNNMTPIDFVSYHDYFQVYNNDTNILRDELDKRPYYKTVQMHLNEFNVYWPSDVYSETKSDTFMKTYKPVSLAFDAFQWLSEHPEITIISWATFIDNFEGLGVIDFDGNPLATYNALKIYQNMPIDRVRLISNIPSVKGMASTDSHKSGIVLWNTSKNEQLVNLGLNNLPFSVANVSVYRIDSNNASYGDNKLKSNLNIIEKIENCNLKNIQWSGKIPALGVVYIEIDDQSSLSELNQRNKIGTLIRKDYYFDNRKKNTYSEWDDLTSIVYIGMGTNDIGRALSSITMENVKDTISVNTKLTGSLSSKSANSTLGIRVDYRNKSKMYNKSVLYQYKPVAGSGNSEFPWGTKTIPSKIVNLTDLSKFNINIKSEAPNDWDGRVIISFQMQDCGNGSEAKFILK